MLELTWWGSVPPGEGKRQRCVDRHACLVRLLQPTPAELAIDAERAA